MGRDNPSDQPWATVIHLMGSTTLGDTYILIAARIGRQRAALQRGNGAGQIMKPRRH
jgi:hypothetical protein